MSGGVCPALTDSVGHPRVRVPSKGMKECRLRPGRRFSLFDFVGEETLGGFNDLGHRALASSLFSPLNLIL